MTDWIKTALEEAQINLSLTHSHARTQANKLQKEKTFNVGDQVVLSTQHLFVDQHLPAKLSRRWVGPCNVAKVTSLVTYGLDMAPTWWIHPVFHVSNLKRCIWSAEFIREEQPPPPISVNREEEDKFEVILRHKGKGSSHLYQVLWKGYPITKASWEPESHLQNAPHILEDYLCQVAKVESQQSRTRGDRRRSWWRFWGVTPPRQCIGRMRLAVVGDPAAGRVIIFSMPNPHEQPPICSYTATLGYYPSACWCQKRCRHLFSGFPFLYFFSCGFFALFPRSEDSRSFWGGDVVTSSRFHKGHYIFLLGCWDSG